jgi:sigma-B regulation protein RsbU (phosphoserine phosphatase)
MMPVEYSAAPISDGGAVVTFRDIRLRLERRQQRRDLKAAQAMQGLLYPQSPPRWPGFEIAGAVFPAGDVCGDYYDFIERDDHRLALIVADASGHDLTAALMMVNARANLRSFLKTHHDLETVLHCVNEILSEELQMGKFVTTFLAELDSRDRSMTFLGAGQSALLVPCQGCDVSLKSGGLMLGIQNDLQLSRPETRTLRSGDVVIVSTDGFSETMSPTGRLLGTQRIIEFVQQTRHLPAQQILNGIVNLARDHAAEEWPRDDATLVVVKTL